MTATRGKLKRLFCIESGKLVYAGVGLGSEYRWDRFIPIEGNDLTPYVLRSIVRVFQTMFDDCNFVHPTEVEEHEITGVDEDGCVKYADGSHGWVYSYLIGDIHIRKDGSQEVRGPYRQVYGINHKPKVKITEEGAFVSDSLPSKEMVL